ncbi:hypothetical protein C8J56DRAFT_813769 [Mycena floridula]|nr:hypothetical protein C8J56DRAFT_813769 [Mycena floridula]
MYAPDRTSRYPPQTRFNNSELHRDEFYPSPPPDAARNNTFPSPIYPSHNYPEYPTSASTEEGYDSYSPVYPTPFVVPSSASDSLNIQKKEAKARKPRQKPRIALAPDQPPTTQGKSRIRVYVACLQCRTRKIRCDGAKPVCHNCSRRVGGDECNYDPIPKRRGPDKTPGARQRGPRDLQDDGEHTGSVRRRTRKKETSSSEEIRHSNEYSVSPTHPHPTTSLAAHHNLTSPSTSMISPSEYSHSPVTPVYMELCPCHGLSPCPTVHSSNAIYHSSQSSFGYRPTLPYTESLPSQEDEQYQRENSISPQPSLDFTRRIWWDSLLSLYATGNRHQALTSAERNIAAQGVATDIKFLFRISHTWFSFIHVPTFFANYHDPVRRQQIQPCMILAAIAISVFFQSSEQGRGMEGRQQAMRFRDEAQGSLEASYNAGWVDESLAQAAWMLAMFEICAHPDYSTFRSVSSMVLLDQIIHSLCFTAIDVNDPQANVFQTDAVPTVTVCEARSSPISYPSPPQASLEIEGCICNSLTLGRHWMGTSEHTPLWHATPAWNPSWSEPEIRRESIRRLCWSSMILAGAHNVYGNPRRSAAPQFWLSDPANYAILFSGESISRSMPPTGHSPKETIWALHERTYLLGHSCTRMRRNDVSAAESDKAQFAIKAWLEADAIEAALNRHTCNLERNYLFQARELLFNVRSVITYEFRRYIPLVPAGMNGLFHRKKAEEWLTHQAVVARRFLQGLDTITGNVGDLLSRRPFFIFWFMGQVYKALMLWQCDNTMLLALDVCKAFLPAIEYLSNIWPCPEQRYRYQELLERLSPAFASVGYDLST